MSLIDLDCRHSKAQSKSYKLTDSEGLYLDVRPTGKKYWRLRYYYYGKEKIYTIGHYPNITFVKAREKRDAAKAISLEGRDTSAQKQEGKQLVKYIATQIFKLVANGWHDRYKDRWTIRHADSLIYHLKHHVFPSFGRLPLEKVTPPLILVCVQKIEDRKKHELAKRVLQIIGQVFRYAVATGRVEQDLTRDLKGALRSHTVQSFASFELMSYPIFK